MDQNNNNDNNEEIERQDNEEEKETKTRKSNKIRIDMNAIPCIEIGEQEEELRALGITAYDQSVYEEGVMVQVDHALDRELRQTSNEPKTNLQRVLDLDSNHFPSIDLKHCSLPPKTLQSLKLEPESAQSFDNLSNNEVDNQMTASCSKTSCDNRNRFNAINRNIEDCSDSDTNDNDIINEDDDEWQPSEDDYKSDEQLEFEDNLINSESDLDLDSCGTSAEAKKGKKSSKTLKKNSCKSNELIAPKRSIRTRVIDDGSDKSYQKRIK